MNRASRRRALARCTASAGPAGIPADVGRDLVRILLASADRLTRWLEQQNPPLPGYVVICEHGPGVITLALDARATIERLLAAIDPAAAARFAEKRPRADELLAVVVSARGESATVPIRFAPFAPIAGGVG